jgi:hypothetical protein
MIVDGQENIKVHFAGGESLIRSNLILDVSEANYSLFTIFPFLCDKFGIKHGYQTKGTTYKEVAANNQLKSKHCIQDSGLFSLMFGSFQADRDENFIQRWYDAIVETVLENGYTGTLVEVDCQKVLGVKKAWELRKKMKNDLPNNRQINVFHIDDKQKGLDEMIEFSDYIAISVPELRSLGKKNYTEKLANYIKNKKPNIDIHLLGCTENKLLKELNFCSSADSTSWVSLNKFGWFKFNDGTSTVSAKKSTINRQKLIEQYGSKVLKAFEDSKVKNTDSLLYYHCCDAMQLEFLLNQYERYAGNQN